MKGIRLIMAGTIMAFAMALTCSSCTKKEDAPKKMVEKEAQRTTPEQAEQKEKIKEGIKKSQDIVIARVNGEEITMYYLVREMNTVAPKYVPNGQSITPEITARVKKEALDNLIFRELAVQEAIRQGMSVKPEAVADVISKVKAQAGSEEAYRKYLEERGADEATLRKMIEKSHLFEMITAREIFGKIKMDDKSLRDTYDKEKALFVTKEKPPRQLSFEEAKGLIERKIKTERSAKRIAEWENELRRKAKIEVMPDKIG